MSASEFVDGGRHPAHVGPRGNLHGPAANKAEGTPAVALSGVPLPTRLPRGYSRQWCLPCNGMRDHMHGVCAMDWWHR